MSTNNRKLVNQIIKEIQRDASDEDVLHLLLENKVTTELSKKDAYSFGQKAADKIASFVGSWTFILVFMGILVVWMAVNVIALAMPFDPYPFILLNLVLSCVAAIQAPLVMMSQNRQEQKDRKRSENDYKVNLKTEIVIEDLHKKADVLLREQAEIKSLLLRLQNQNENTHINQ